MRWLFLFLSLLAAGDLRAKHPEGALRVLGIEGTLRLYRFETEPWPLEPGQRLPDNSRVELDPGAKLRLRYRHYLDFVLSGPARLTVYVIPAPVLGELEPGRVVLKLDEGALLVDGRFQLGRPADFVLGLPDRSQPLPRDRTFVAVASHGRSAFYRPLSAPARSALPLPAEPGRAVDFEAVGGKAPKRLPFPQELLDELERPVDVFVIARDFNKDVGLWPRPAVLGPLLSERLADLSGLRVVEGSGDTYYAYRANAALKSGQDFFLKELARARGARWVVLGNCVVESLRGNAGRWVRGVAEVRVLEAEGDSEGLELVSESGDTRVARLGRPLELVARQAFEAASAEVAEHLAWQLQNLLQGKAHSETLLRLTLSGANAESLERLKARLAGMDSVQKVFRRSYSRGEARFDLLLRKSLADFDAQWSTWPQDPVWRFRRNDDGTPLERHYTAERVVQP
jgi:hypothetical protein